MSGGVGAVRRPGVVTFVGLVIYIQAFLGAVAGVVLLAFKGDVQDYLSSNGADLSNSQATTSAIASLVVALFLFIVGAGIMRGSRGWRMFVVLIEALNMALAIYQMVVHPHGAFITTGLVALLVGFFVIWALYGHKESEEYFESS